jgi:hypothetical protein
LGEPSQLTRAKFIRTNIFAMHVTAMQNQNSAVPFGLRHGAERSRWRDDFGGDDRVVGGIGHQSI